MAENNSILIVDDEPELREIIAFDFENAGFEVACAENGKVALDLMDKKTFGAIVSDIRMPVMDGPELLKHVREKRTDIVFIFISAYSDLTVEAAMNNGVDGIMIKPFDRRNLVSTVNRLLLPAQQKWNVDIKDLTQVQDFSCVFPSLTEAKKQNQILLGRGGIFVASPGKLPSVGANVSFKIQFEAEKVNLEGVGIVRWIRPDDVKGKLKGFGLEFLKLDGATSDYVSREIKNASPVSFIPA